MVDPLDWEPEEALEQLWERDVSRRADPRLVELASRIYAVLKVYHRHEVFGAGNIPATGPCVLAVNHSLATYDIIMLQVALRELTGRMARGLGDRQIFRWPGLSELAMAFGAVEGAPEAGRALLDEGELLLVAPGGMREALRPSSERYMLRWRRRKGFVRLALEARAPVVLAACPHADDIFTVYPSQVTAQAYQRYRFPLPVLRGLGVTLMPRPVKLVHVLSEPLYPPEYEGDVPPRAVIEQFHDRVVGRMHKLMEEALSRHVGESYRESSRDGERGEGGEGRDG